MRGAEALRQFHTDCRKAGVSPVYLLTYPILMDEYYRSFLQEAARQTGTKVTIHAKRIDVAPAIQADVVTARALARLAILLDHAQRFLKPEAACYFLKGALLADELTEVLESWHMKVSEFPSLSDASGVIVKLESIVRERQ